MSNVILSEKQFHTLPVGQARKAIEGGMAFEQAFAQAVRPEDADWIPVFDPEDTSWKIETIGCYGFAVDYRKRDYNVQPGLAFMNGLGMQDFMLRREKLAAFREQAEEFAQNVAIGVTEFDLYEHLGRRNIPIEPMQEQRTWPVAMFIEEHDEPLRGDTYLDFHFTAFRRVITEEGLKYAWVEKAGRPAPTVMGTAEQMFSKISGYRGATWRFGGFFAAYQHA